MDNRLEKKLVEKYPQIFRDYGGDKRHTCMVWGMECGDGWFLLIDKMCKDITKICKRTNIQVIASQVKEKFGGLRFYYFIDNEHSILSRLNFKTRTIMFSKRLGTQYWKIIKFKRKFWKSPEEKIEDIIEKAESKSYETCETCGRRGTSRGQGWVYTACDSCEEQYEQGYRQWKNPDKFPDVFEFLFGKE